MSDEGQPPRNDFILRDQAAKSVVPPRRPYADPLTPSRSAGVPGAVPSPKPPAPGTGGVRTNNIVPPRVPAPTSRTLASTGGIPATLRPVPTPTKPPASELADDAPVVPSSAAPVPPVPRHTGPIPAPPPPRHTTSLPTPTRVTSLPGTTSTSGPASFPPTGASEESSDVSALETPAPEPGQPDPNADDLQRLAALAMAELGDRPEPISASPPTEAAPGKPASGAALDEPLPSSKESLAPSAKPAESTPSSVPMPAQANQENASAPDAPVAFNLNTCTVEDLVENIPDCSEELAESIVAHRTKIGSFKRIEELLEVPGVTPAAYTNLTGEAPPAQHDPLSLNELLGFPPNQEVSLKDVTDRIACWPDVTGCVLSQNSGLSLVGSVPAGIDKAAIVAFAPRMFDTLNKSFSEVAGKQTDALFIPTADTSFHLFRNNDLYLIIMARLPQMPERHMKVARFVLAALSTRKD
jgi:DNA uptake protein ComE-like DNA-binding protein